MNLKTVKDTFCNLTDFWLINSTKSSHLNKILWDINKKFHKIDVVETTFKDILAFKSNKLKQCYFD